MKPRQRRAVEHARGFIAKGWTKFTRARDGSGEIVDALSPEATCWCVEGAFARGCNIEDLGVVGGTGPLEGEFVDTAHRLFDFDCDEHGPRCPFPACFNDAPGTTAEMIDKVFEEMLS